jgi:hypothetical protein
MPSHLDDDPSQMRIPRFGDACRRRVKVNPLPPG